MSHNWSQSTHSAGSNPYITRAYENKSVEDTRDLYDEWALNYDKDLAADEYAAPRLAAKEVLSAMGKDRMPNAVFLDAGCGTGLVGKLLARDGALTIDGVDLSPGMLDVARKTGVYRDLREADLSQAMEQRDESYDVVACVGTLTRAHVGPSVLGEFGRIVKKDGFIVATILNDIWESGGYKAEVDHLVEGGKVEIVHVNTVGYRVSSDVGAKMLLVKKL